MRQRDAEFFDDVLERSSVRDWFSPKSRPVLSYPHSRLKRRSYTP